MCRIKGEFGRSSEIAGFRRYDCRDRKEREGKPAGKEKGRNFGIEKRIFPMNGARRPLSRDLAQVAI
jgi:hypothetical protein